MTDVNNKHLKIQNYGKIQERSDSFTGITE